MSKFYGMVGYGITSEDEYGVTIQNVIEKPHYGDVITFNRRVTSSDKANDDIELNLQVSILADMYAQAHFQYMLYVEYMGSRWKVTNVTPAFPRLILSLGGLYNAETA